MIRPVAFEDTKAVLELAGSSGLFSPDEQEEISARLHAYFQDQNGSLWIAYEEQKLEGIAYCVQEPMTHGTWNILMLLVREASQGRGAGTALIQQTQRLLAEHNARMLIVETSGTEGFESTRRFYTKSGFVEVARIPNFYDAGDDKIIFSKLL